MNKVLDQNTLDDATFWQGKRIALPTYDRKHAQVKSLCFSAGRMAYGHTGDILQDLLSETFDTAEGGPIDECLKECLNPQI